MLVLTLAAVVPFLASRAAALVNDDNMRSAVPAEHGVRSRRHSKSGSVQQAGSEAKMAKTGGYRDSSAKAKGKAHHRDQPTTTAEPTTTANGCTLGPPVCCPSEVSTLGIVPGTRKSNFDAALEEHFRHVADCDDCTLPTSTSTSCIMPVPAEPLKTPSENTPRPVLDRWLGAHPGQSAR